MIQFKDLNFSDLNHMKSEIIRINNIYRIGFPEMSDKDFDELYKKYTMLSGKPIKEIDGVVNFIKLTGEKDDLQVKEFTGLNKLTSINDIIKWIEKYNLYNTKLILTPKIDGVSTFVDYDLQNSINKNHLDVYIKSKDNGASPIWNHFTHVQNTCDNISVPNGEQHIGEIICLNNVFNEKYVQEYKNVRNFVAGKLNPSSESSSYLNDFIFIRYTLAKSDKNKSDMIEHLNQFNVYKIPYIEFIISDNSNLNLLEDKFYAYYKQWSVDFVIDGIIIDVDNSEIRKELGFDTKGNPKFTVAYKNEDTFGDRANVKVRSLQFPIDKDGQFNPCITTDLVMLDGAECGKNIFVDTIDFIRKNKISVGADIIIKRGGQIIPRVYKVLTNQGAEMFDSYKSMVDVNILPKNCPYCGTEIQYDENEVTMKCSNENCSEVFLKRIEFFFTQIKAKNIGEKLVRQFAYELYTYSKYHLDFITTILRTSESEFRKFENFGDRKAEITYKSIHDAFGSASLAQLMSATNLFPNLAETKISWVLEKYDITFQNIYRLQNLTFENIKTVDGYADKSASVFYKGITSFLLWYENIKEMFELKENTSSVAGNISEELVGKRFCFTGFRNGNLEKLIIERGGKIKNSFSLDITILVVKDKSASPTTKVQKAEKAGIKIIDEKELYQMINLPLNDLVFGVVEDTSNTETNPPSLF